ncbi:hypothetical protein G7Y79_00011g031440 [Physcia stellaris]|nr:hypothetical protein G7Y79_00011g031440 [Physcia stellaris]
MILRAPTSITSFRKNAESQVLGFSRSNVRGYLSLGEAQDAYKSHLQGLQEAQMVSYAVMKGRREESTLPSYRNDGSTSETDDGSIKTSEPPDGNGGPASSQTEYISPKRSFGYGVGQKDGVDAPEEEIINSNAPQAALPNRSEIESDFEHLREELEKDDSSEIESDFQYLRMELEKDGSSESIEGYCSERLLSLEDKEDVDIKAQEDNCSIEGRFECPIDQAYPDPQLRDTTKVSLNEEPIELEPWIPSTAGVKRRAAAELETALNMKSPRLEKRQTITSSRNTELLKILDYRSQTPDMQAPRSVTKDIDFKSDYPWVVGSDSREWYDGSTLDERLSRAFSDVTSKCDPPLCQEQMDLIQLIMSGRNVFYTGSAGCGKSTVLKAFVEILRKAGRHVYVVASTGIASIAVGGKTFWSYAGWSPNLMKRAIEKLKVLAHNKRTWHRHNHTEVLVIDEISMMENHYFERLNVILKESRAHGRDKAFGGIQLIVTGDFCQLPPVKPFQHCYPCGRELLPASGGIYRCIEHGEFRHSDQFAFKSVAWKECEFVYINLKNIHRQSDPEFKRILERIRLSKPINTNDRNLLLNHTSETAGAVKLFPKRRQAKAVNDREFALLDDPIKTFPCWDHFQHNPNHWHLDYKKERDPETNTLIALEDHRFESELNLRVGMRVILLVNLDFHAELVNGSQGVVVGFRKEEHIQDVCPSNEHAVYKCARVADFIAQASTKEYPVVRFIDGEERTIFPSCQVDELGDREPVDEGPYSLISRTQIPLMAAWAMTIHKCQGMTLKRVVVDLSDAWECGQEYVALSRATSLEGLKVEALSQRVKEGDPQVAKFLLENFGSLEAD